MFSPRLRSLLWIAFLLLAAWGLRAPYLSREQWNLDEGSTFTMAEQILAGDVLYRDAADQRNALVPYLKAAIFSVAGHWNAFAVHLTIALLLGACAVGLWWMGRRLGDEPAGIAAALAFTVLSFVLIDPGDAMSASTGWFLVIFSTFGYVAFVAALGRPGFLRGLPAGLLFGGSILCKQPGLLDFGVTWVLLAFLAATQPGRRVAYLKFWCGMLAGAAAPSLAFAAYFAAHHALDAYIYYAFTFNNQIYVPAIPLLRRLLTMSEPFKLAWNHSPVALLLVLTAILILGERALRALRRRPITFPLLPWLILGWTAAAVYATGLSGRAYSHYSAQVVPGFSLACGWLIARWFEFARRPASGRWRRSGVAIVLVAAACAFGYDCVRRLREFGPNDTLTLEMGRMVAAHSTPSDRVFVWGCFPEIYFFSHRLPASRFIYTNFLTGLIPWTNLDPLIDTSDVVVPHAWEQLESDFQRHPPAVVVDTGTARGQLKYPLHSQPLLWNLVKTQFAQVSVDPRRFGTMRFFRRLAVAAPATLESSLKENTSIGISGFNAFKLNEPARVRVTAPAGANRVELYAGGARIAALDHPISEAVDILFFVDPELPGRDDLRAVIATAVGRTVSASFNFARYAGNISAHPLPGPRLNVEQWSLAPVALDLLNGVMVRSPEHPHTWRVDAPDQLEFPCPAGLSSISFVHGRYAETQGRSDGYDLLVDFVEASGQRVPLYQRRLHPRTNLEDRKPQEISLRLPPHNDGRLVFRFLAGERNDPEFDQIFFGQLRGDSNGPILRLGERMVLPVLGAMRNGELMTEHNGDRWLAQAPGRIEWPRPSALTALTLHYGIDAGAYTAKNGHSDGMDFSLDLIDEHGKTHALFSRTLEPFNHVEHRGPQISRVEIPPGPGGVLVLRVGPGARGDASWDWGWVGPLVCEGPGPNIVISPTRLLMPLSSKVGDGNGPSKPQDDVRWNAHAPSELVYHRPGDLARVIFEYGLAEGAARDETGKQRSDGVDVVVEFQATGRAPVELFHRNLDPFSRPADAGMQTSTVELPPYQEGRLVFRITPGPFGSNAFDWAAWGRFVGEAN